MATRSGGIPDIQAAAKAAERGEYLPALGQAAWGAMPALSLALPALRGLAPTADEAGMLASRSARLYNPPAKAPRPFSADYPNGAPADAAGNLTADIEGRPLTAQFVAGRNSLGGADVAVSPEELDTLAESATGAPPAPVAARQIGGDAGRLLKTYSPDTGAPLWNIGVDRSLPAVQQNRVVGHCAGRRHRPRGRPHRPRRRLYRG